MTTFRLTLGFGLALAVFTPLVARADPPGDPAAVTNDQGMWRDKNGDPTYKVSADGTVSPKQVQIGELRGGLRVIRSGLSPADRVIVDSAHTSVGRIAEIVSRTRASLGDRAFVQFADRADADRDRHLEAFLGLRRLARAFVHAARLTRPAAHDDGDRRLP